MFGIEREYFVSNYDDSVFNDTIVEEIKKLYKKKVIITQNISRYAGEGRVKIQITIYLNNVRLGNIIGQVEVTLQRMPNNCGTMIISSLGVYSGDNVLSFENVYAILEEFSISAGFSNIIYATTQQQTELATCLKKRNYKEIEKFVNSRTHNTITLWSKTFELELEDYWDDDGD